MKRHGHLFERLCDFGHLYHAFRKAIKGSGHTMESRDFWYHLEYELLYLSNQLRNGFYTPSPYRQFQIYEPKKRIISVAPFCDRVVHHAVVMLLESIFDPTFVFHSYATRKGKGTQAAILQAQRYLRGNQWFFKADICQYFASINHDILLSLLNRKVKDKHFMNVVEKIIRNGGENGCGLPIGNLTSQFFANVYLNRFDHFIKQDLRAKAYVRYMDDFVCMSNEKGSLKEWKRKIDCFLFEELDLNLKEKACFFNHRDQGLSFLGTRIFKSTIRIKRENLVRSIKKIQRKVKARKEGKLSEEQFMTSMNSHWGHLGQYDTLAVRKSILKNYPGLHG